MAYQFLSTILGSNANFTGLVGIGTTSPIAMLDIYSPTNGYASVGLQGYSGATKWFLTSGISGVTIQDFAIGNNNNGTSPKLVITSSGNVLIGTTNDIGYKLQVNADSWTNGAVRISGANPFYFENYGGGWYMGDTTWVRTWNQKSVWAGGGILGSDGGLTIGYGGASGVPTGGAVIAGNVGIGTTSPNFVSAGRTVLDINGSSNTLLCFSVGGIPQSYLYQSGGDLNISNEVSGAIKFYTSGSERMRIASSGQVGINNSTIYHGANLSVANKIFLSFQPNADIGGTIYGYYDTSLGGYYGGLKFQSFKFNGSSYVMADAMTINGIGNVGIGTTSPYNKFVSVNNAVYNDENSYSIAAAAASDTAYKTVIGYDYSNDVGVISAVRAGITWKNLSLAPVGGNVLIGTTADNGSKLQVAGNATLGQGQNRPVTYDSFGGNFRITANPGGWATGYFFNGSSGTFRGGFGAYGDFDNMVYHWIGDDYNVPTMVLYPNQGSVGIGTTTPLLLSSGRGNLTINGSSQSILTLSAANNWKSYLYTEGTNTYLGAMGLIDFSVNGAATLAMRLATSGNVLIGTATDVGDKLYVVGTSRVQTGTYGLGTTPFILNQLTGDTRSVSLFLGNEAVYNQPGAYATNTVNGSIAGIKFGWYSDNWMISATRSGGGGIYGFVISQNGSEKLVIGNTGNVGIGTTTPTEKLSVNGNIALPKSGNTFIYNDQSGADSITIGGASYFSVKTFNGANYTEVFRATATNNLLIGTTTDNGYRLQVAGDTTMSGTLSINATSNNGFNLDVEGTASFLETVVQNVPANPNALGGMTSHQTQDNLTNNFVNNTYSGETITGQLASNVSAGQILVLRNGALLWDKADASFAGPLAYNMLGIACADGIIGQRITILLRGFYASNSWYGSSPQYGSPMYLSPNTPGNAEETVPSTTGDVVRIVGHIDDYSNANGVFVLRFNPDNFWLVI